MSSLFSLVVWFISAEITTTMFYQYSGLDVKANKRAAHRGIIRANAIRTDKINHHADKLNIEGISRIKTARAT